MTCVLLGFELMGFGSFINLGPSVLGFVSGALKTSEMRRSQVNTAFTVGTGQRDERMYQQFKGSPAPAEAYRDAYRALHH